jgi:hypothetical protein
MLGGGPDHGAGALHAGGVIHPGGPTSKQRESQTILFKIASFEAKPSIAGSGLSCPVVTGDWVLVELVDPKEDNIYGQTTDFVKIRVLNASRPLPSYDLGVSVRDRYGEEGVGSVSVTGPLPQEVYVRLNRGGLQPPLQFEVVSEDPNLTVIPFEWGFSNSFGNFIDFTKLRINLERFLIDEIIVSSGFYESGSMSSSSMSMTVGVLLFPPAVSGLTLRSAPWQAI